MSLSFTHTLPDGNYVKEGHKFNGKSLAILYAMGMLYNTKEVIEKDFTSVNEYITFITTYLNEAKIAYAKELNKNAEEYIIRNLNRFLKKLNKTSVELEGITTTLNQS